MFLNNQVTLYQALDTETDEPTTKIKAAIKDCEELIKRAWPNVATKEDIQLLEKHATEDLQIGSSKISLNDVTKQYGNTEDLLKFIQNKSADKLFTLVDQLQNKLSALQA